MFLYPNYTANCLMTGARTYISSYASWDLAEIYTYGKKMTAYKKGKLC